MDRLKEKGKADLAIGVLCNLCLDYGTLPSVPSHPNSQADDCENPRK